MVGTKYNSMRFKGDKLAIINEYKVQPKLKARVVIS